MSFEALAEVTDVSVGDWIAPRLGEFGGWVGSVAPRGFAAYARVLHPATDAAGDPVGWADVCRLTDRVPHALMQWHSVARTVWHQDRGGRWPRSRAVTTRTSSWPGEAPDVGNVPPAVLATALDVLATYTAGDCIHAVWEGWGWLPADLREGALLRHPQRNYLLFRGSVRAALSLGEQATPDWFIPQSPSLLWPADRTWCLATEIDFDSTLVGGPTVLIDALLAAPGLEAWPVTVSDDLSFAGDLVNR